MRILSKEHGGGSGYGQKKMSSLPGHSQLHLHLVRIAGLLHLSNLLHLLRERQLLELRVGVEDLREVPDGGDRLDALLVDVARPLKQAAPDIVVRQRVPEVTHLQQVIGLFR